MYRDLCNFVHFSHRHIFTSVAKVGDEDRTVHFQISAKDPPRPDADYFEIVDAYYATSNANVHRGVHTLGMSFPIDVIYLSEENTVVHLESTLAPWRFAPVRWNAKTVLEVPCTTIQSTGTALGDSIEILRAS